MPVVTFYVGPDKVVFHVHENFLFDASPVFRAAFSGNFKEASERSMPLPEDDKESVELMILWLYTKRLGLTIPVSAETSNECYMQLAKLNTLAEKYDICLLKNDIVNELFDLKKSSKNIKPPQILVVKHVYDNTPARSSFRKLMVAWYTYHINCAWYEEEDARREDLASISQDFAIDLALALGRRQKYPERKSPFTLLKERFHETATKEIDEDCEDCD